MLVKETRACGGTAEAEDDDRSDVQRAINTWRKLHVCGVRIGYYQSESHARGVDGLNGRVETALDAEEEVPLSVS